MNQILALAESSLAALKAYRASRYTQDEHAASALQSLQQIVAPQPSPAQTRGAHEALPIPAKPQVRRSARLKQQRRLSLTYK